VRTGSIVAGMSIGRGRLKSVGGHVVLALLALTALFPAKTQLCSAT